MVNGKEKEDLENKEEERENEEGNENK